jgi:hypothetical protein
MQMSNLAKTRFDRLARLVPCAGVGFAVATAVGFLLMGKNPEPDGSIPTITRYWSSHHAHVHTAAMVLAYGGVLFALFGTSIWAWLRSAALHPLLKGSALVGTSLAAVGLLASAMTYVALGDIAAKPTTLPATVQALHVFGAELSYPIAGGVELLLLAVAAAGIAGRVLPRWLAWLALPIGLLQLTTIGFTAFLLFLAWSAATSVALLIKPAAPVVEEARRSPSTSTLVDSH